MFCWFVDAAYAEFVDDPDYEDGQSLVDAQQYRHVAYLLKFTALQLCALAGGISRPKWPRQTNASAVPLTLIQRHRPPALPPWATRNFCKKQLIWPKLAAAFCQKGLEKWAFGLSQRDKLSAGGIWAACGGLPCAFEGQRRLASHGGL